MCSDLPDIVFEIYCGDMRIHFTFNLSHIFLECIQFITGPHLPWETKYISKNLEEHQETQRNLLLFRSPKLGNTELFLKWRIQNLKTISIEKPYFKGHQKATGSVKIRPFMWESPERQMLIMWEVPTSCVLLVKILCLTNFVQIPEWVLQLAKSEVNRSFQLRVIVRSNQNSGCYFEVHMIYSFFFKKKI